MSTDGEEVQGHLCQQSRCFGYEDRNQTGTLIQAQDREMGPDELGKLVFHRGVKFRRFHEWSDRMMRISLVPESFNGYQRYYNNGFNNS